MSANEWVQLPGQFDEHALGISVFVISKRFLTAFGGTNYDDEVPDKEMIRTLDCLRPQSGWKIHSLSRPSQSPCGFRYGSMDITGSDADQKFCQILIFGGVDRNETYTDRCMVFSGSLPALEDGTLTALSKRTGKEQKTEERLRKAASFD